MLRPSDRVLDLLDETLRRMKTMGDQPALNRTLCSRKVSWEPAESYTLEFRGKEVCQTYDTRIGRSGDLSIALLPNRLFQRLPEPEQNPFVIHPTSPKVEEEKIGFFREMGLWREFQSAN